MLGQTNFPISDLESQSPEPLELQSSETDLKDGRANSLENGILKALPIHMMSTSLSEASTSRLKIINPSTIPIMKRNSQAPWQLFSEVMSGIFVVLIDIYRFSFLSQLFGGQCRFHPSCSLYGREAFRVFGLRRGFVLTIKRICRCHPFGKSGDDPLPMPNQGK